jgi:parallel beta-helix repeat protein
MAHCERVVVRFLMALGLCGIVACTGRTAMPLGVSGVEPALAVQGERVQLAVKGSGFVPRVRVSYIATSRSTLETTFLVRVGDVAVQDVQMASDSELLGALDVDLPPGVYDVTVTDPAGVEATYPAGFTVLFSGKDRQNGDGPALPGESVEIPPGSIDPNHPNNHVPGASLLVTPTVGVPATVRSFDASASTDVDNDALEARFDADGDGVFERDWGPLTATHTYAAVGSYSVRVEVRDVHGATNAATASAVVISGNVLIVDTDSDAASLPDATTLRAALAAAGSGDAVTFDRAFTILPASALPAVPGGVTLIGRSDVILDGRLLPPGTACLSMPSNGSTVRDMRLIGCPGPGIVVSGNDGTTVGNSMTSGGGISAARANNLVVRKNLVQGCSEDGVRVTDNSNNAFVAENVVIGCGAAGIAVDGQNGVIVQNRAFDNSGDGIAVGDAAKNNDVWHNTLVKNVGAGLRVSAASKSTTVYNNIFAANSGAGLDASNQVTLGTNLFDGNAQACVGCPAEGSAIEQPPGFVDLDARNVHLLPDSAARDAGQNTGFDTNGARAGLFDGAAPDLGAFEAL